MHSQMPAPWFHAIPGMKIVAPAFPADAKGLLKAAIRDDNPVLFLEHKRLYALKGAYDPDAEELCEIGRAVIRREGGDLTIVAAMKGVHDSLAAAERLAADHGIEAEVIDLRTLRPLDVETIRASVARTNRLLILEEGPLTGGWAGEVLSRLVERSLEDLDDAWRLATPDLPIPYSPPLEDAHLPGVDAIVASVLDRQH
jgi:pyruvate/2-oxoglutarate/acetoin dehydrogenase E1 component